MDRERIERLAARTEEEFPEAWIPNELDSLLVGTFVRLDRGNTSYGPAWIAVFADATTGEHRAVWLLHTALRNELARAKPAAGELVAIRYTGRKQAGNGRDWYESYRVVVDREDQSAAWNELAGPDAPAETTTADPPVEHATTGDDGIPF